MSILVPANVARNLVAITAVDPPGATVVAVLGEKLPAFSSNGGWKFETRPRRSGFTEYGGVEPYTLTLSLLWDGFAVGQEMEGQIEQLRLMMRTRVGSRGEPPVVRLKGEAVPLTWLDWVIQDIAPGDELRDDNGQIVRAFRDVTFFQYLSPDVLSAPSVGPATQAASAAPATQIAAGAPVTTPAARTYTVRAGDTLSAIAVKFYSNVNRWTDIANLNGIRDPRALQVGQVLKLP